MPDPDRGPAARLGTEQVLAWRVGRHHLRAPAPREAVVAVVGAICGVHAQLLSSAEQAIRARVADFERGDLERLLWEERALVKTWAMRGTLHLLPANEYRLWQAALSTYRHYLKGAWLREFGFTRQELEETLEVIADILAGRSLTREELAEEVARQTGATERREKLLDSWGATLKPAAFRGHLCHAPGEAGGVRFTDPVSWLGIEAEAEIDPDAAVREVTRRYLSAYGPASREVYARWAGLQAAEAGRRIDALGEEVVSVEVDGRRAWMLAVDVDDAIRAEPSGSVRTLPRFDPYVVGAPRGDPGILTPGFRDRVYRTAGWISAVLLVDGRIEGVWDYEERGDRLDLRIEPFEELPAWVRDAATREAESLAAFMGAELRLSWRS